MDADQITAFAGELICKQLVGRPPEFNGRQDPTFDYSKPRRFGFILGQDETHTGAADSTRRALEEGCNLEIGANQIIEYNADTDAGSSKADGLATAITRLKADGVTTIVCGCDAYTPVVFTSNATQQGYYPEWVMIGTAETDDNANARLYDKAQWSHALGFTSDELARPFVNTPCYRAYRTVDPNAEPVANVCKYYFRDLQQIATAIQLAGPNLTPQTFQRALTTQYPRRPPSPEWAVGGGYGAGDYTLSDYIAMVWFDPTAPDPASNPPGTLGAYRALTSGRRYTHGEIPVEPLQFFKEGTSRVDDGDG